MVKLKPECIKCLFNKYSKKVPVGVDEATETAYLKGLLNILYEAPLSDCAPLIVDKINKLQKELFNYTEDYTEVKKYFNALMLTKQDEVRRKTDVAEEPLRMAIRYAMLGNYIDFGMQRRVDENDLEKMLDEVQKLAVNDGELENLHTDLERAQRMVFITDNCGEIVLDKLLVERIAKEYPHLSLTVIVRGMPVLNDATMEDAREVGLCDELTVIDNGNGVAGTCFDMISDAAKEVLDSADVIIAKGQANFETMRGSGRNVYYVFLCKCKMFCEQFGVEQYSGMMVNDIRTYGKITE
jgi:uncharacterized protein with ATP-grasp and redox domains